MPLTGITTILQRFLKRHVIHATHTFNLRLEHTERSLSRRDSLDRGDGRHSCTKSQNTMRATAYDMVEDAETSIEQRDIRK